MTGVVQTFVQNGYVGRPFNMEDVANGGVPRLGAAVPRDSLLPHPNAFRRPPVFTVKREEFYPSRRRIRARCVC
jgi:hypothetical protein